MLQFFIKLFQINELLLKFIIEKIINTGIYKKIVIAIVFSSSKMLILFWFPSLVEFNFI